MNEYAQALAMVYGAVEMVNRQLPADRRLQKSPDTIIAGTGGVLDSLSLTNFIVSLEETLGDATRRPIRLLDEDVLATDSPLRTIDTLTRYIAARMG